MGIDAVVTFRPKPGAVSMSAWVAIKAADTWRGVGGAFQVDMDGERYWSPDYRRGDWTKIAAVLMRLMADPAVEAVWYHGDCHDDSPIPPFTIDDLAEYCREYINQPRKYP